MKSSPAGRRYAPLGAVLILLAGGVIAWAAWPRGPEFAQVEGLITLDGKPLAEVEVQFLPDPEKSNPGPTASSYTDAQGRYRLRCEKARADGAVLGPHRVCVIDITAIPPPGPPPLVPPPGQRKVSRVPSAYTDPARTPLRDVEVKSGKQALDFNLVSRKPR